MTGNEKGLVLERTEKEGVPIYYVESALHSVFSIGGNIPLHDYNTKLVLATSDSTNVNLGVYNGALTMVKAEDPWLVVIHCV